MRERKALALAWAPALLALAPGAAATTVVKLERAELVRRATRILEGTVTARRSHRDARGRIATTIDLRIAPSGCLKGAGAGVVQLTFPGGVLEGERRATIVPGMPRFALGEQVLVFVADSRRGGLQLPVGLAQGKFSIRVDPATGRRILVRDLAGLELVGPRGGRPVRARPGRQVFDYQEWRRAIARQVAGR